ncbi:peptidoglycan-binding domain-containing protein [Pelagibacterium lacus]|nr:peptidoglycan-binding domain-containing protein [Pelagibacterium lacus]
MTTTLVNVSTAIGAGAWAGLSGACRWSAEKFLASPLAASGLVLATGLTLMAGTNALYLQETRHPAPLFGTQNAGVATPAPITPVVVEPETVPARPEASSFVASPAPAPQAPVATAPAATEAAPSIGNQDIADMQAKLKEMGMFDGTVDGYYGPKTADAIRAFEARFGLPRTGAATPQVIDAVKKATVNGAAAAPVAPPQPEPQPVQRAEAVTAEPAADAIAPLVAQIEAEATSAPSPTPAPTPEPAPAAEPVREAAAQPTIPAALDRELVSDIQRGLSRLGFLQGQVDGVADETTARAIRKFQIFNNYNPTGEVSPLLRDMLVAAGAYL